MCMKLRLGYVFFWVVGLSICADAQILKDLERAEVNKVRSMNTKENRDKLANALVKEMDRARS